MTSDKSMSITQLWHTELSVFRIEYAINADKITDARKSNNALLN